MTKGETTTRFGLMRHAQTAWNAEKRIQGQQDTELTTVGQQQAESWGRLLAGFHWNSILCSDLNRARATANIINAFLKLPLSFDHRLREQDWGQWVGKTVKQLRREEPQLLAEAENAGWKFRPPEGEDRIDVWERSSQALVQAAGQRTGDTILVVCHGGVIKCLLYKLYGRRFQPTEPRLIKSYHLHWLVCDGNGLQVEEINAVRFDGEGNG
jgi:probable phosphoglycerate mutase